MPLPTLSREDIEEIKRDVYDTIQFSRSININASSILEARIQSLSNEEKELHREIFLYLLEQESEDE